jgi:hypothetical protein
VKYDKLIPNSINTNELQFFEIAQKLLDEKPALLKKWRSLIQRQVEDTAQKCDTAKPGKQPLKSEGKEPTSLTSKESVKISKLLNLDEESPVDVLETLRKLVDIANNSQIEIQKPPGVITTSASETPNSQQVITLEIDQDNTLSYAPTPPPNSKMKHVVGSIVKRSLDVEMGSREHVEQLADQHGGGILEYKFQDDVSFVHSSIKLFYPCSEFLVSHVHSLLQDYVLPLQIQQVNKTGMEIPEAIWQNASMLRYTRSPNKWLPVMKKLSYVKLAQHVNSAEKMLTGAGNPINVAKKAAYAHYIRACYTSEAAYLAAVETGEDAKERRLLQKEKMQGQKFLYLVDRYGLGALAIWPSQLDSKPSVADWSVCRMRSLVDVVSGVDMASGSKLMTLTKFISGWIEKLLFGQMQISTVQNLMETYREKCGMTLVEQLSIEDKLSCDETIHNVIQTLPPVISLGEGLPLYAASLATLYSGSYLDDEIIRAVLTALTRKYTGVFLVDAAICNDTFDAKSVIESGYTVEVPKGTTRLVMVINWEKFSLAHWTLVIASASGRELEGPWVLDFYDSMADNQRKAKADRLVPEIINFLLKANPHLAQGHLALRKISSPQQVTDCGCGIAVILAAHQHLEVGKPSQHPVLTKEMEDDLRGDFAELILETFWRTDQSNLERIPANLEWLSQKGFTTLSTRSAPKQPSQSEVCSTMTVIDKDLWMSKTGTAKLTKRTKRGRAYWLTTGTAEEAMAASDFLDRRLIREAGHGPEKVTTKMCPTSF